MSVEWLIGAAKTLPAWGKFGGVVAAMFAAGWFAHGTVAEQLDVPNRLAAVETTAAQRDTVYAEALSHMGIRLADVEADHNHLENLVSRVLCHLDKQALGESTLLCLNLSAPGG